MTRIRLMLDSGAFSAWNQGTSVDLGGYIGFLKQVEKQLFSYVVLDVLPEGREAARTREANEVCAALSDANQQRMKDAGLRPIPVFHQGESLKWLELMLKNGETYIGISTRKDLPIRAVIPWLDAVWKLLKPAPVKVHGFGITAVNLLWRYPWHTVDSTAWSLGAGFGQIYVPARAPDGSCNYRVSPLGVVTSGGFDKRKMGRHFDGLGPVTQEWVKTYIEDQCGLTMSEVRNSARGRQRAMAFYYTELEKHIVGTRIMFATLYRNSLSDILNSAGVTHRLLSYYEIGSKGVDKLLFYIEHGYHTGDGSPVKARADWNSHKYLSHRRVLLSERQAGYDREAAET